MTTLPKTFFKNPFWKACTKHSCIASSITVYRNFANHQFPGKQTLQEQKKIIDIITKNLPNINFLPAENLSSTEKKFLFEHFLCLDAFQNVEKGQGFLLNDENNFLGIVGVNNHLQLQYICPSENLLDLWKAVSKIETAVEQNHPYAFSSQFGYLTNDPHYCGTGLQAHIYLHIPALIHTKSFLDITPSLKENNCSFSGLDGLYNEFIGNIVIIRNLYKTGYSEETILHSLQTQAKKIVEAEEKIRAEIKKNLNINIQDLIKRSLSLLQNVLQLQIKETLNALSAIKLGVHLGWIQGICKNTLHSLFFQCRHGHLCLLAPNTNYDNDTLAQKRASFVREKLAKGFYAI
jgi:protein arginine kinase